MLELFTFPVKLLLSHGYLALFVWSIFEGEIGLMLAGWLASEGKVFTYVHTLEVAIAGAIIGDLLLYLIGRLFAQSMERWLEERYRKKKHEVERWIQRWGSWVVVFERFIYGTHIPALITVGISGFGFFKFLIFDLVGIVLWAFTFVTIGFHFGHSAIHYILLAQKNVLLIVFLLFLLALYIKSRRRSAR